MNISDATSHLLQLIQDHPSPSTLGEQLASSYQLLIDTLIDHNHRYYIQANPLISDYEYDQLFDYLKRIEEYFPHLISSNSPTQALIGQIAEGFAKADHKFPLLSLENSYNAQDLLDRDLRWRKIAEKTDFHGEVSYHIEPKFDGLSIELTYQNGLLTQAITRGDGHTGEDITANVKTIKNLPLKIPSSSSLRVRWEIMMPKSQLANINQLREAQGLSPFANTRNAAAGSIKLLDSNEVHKRGLLCYVYDILEGDPNFNLTELGLPIFRLPSKFQSQSGIQAVISTCLDFEVKNFLDEQDLDFDGLVIKLADSAKKTDQNQTSPLFSTPELESQHTNIRQLLGATEHHPRRAIAYKFPAQQVSSQILSVDFQVGRTGIITPVANLAPVQLSGATISRVSLHNFDFIQSKQIKNGDFVRLQRSGEVIPYITGVIKERRSGNEDFITAPLLCPKCQSPISNIDIHYYCTNSHCPGQLIEKICYFVSRDAMDIGGFGASVVEVLVEQKMLTSLADLYLLSDPAQQLILRRLPNFGEKKVSELLAQLEKSKTQPLRRLLNGLGIPNIWKKTAQDLASYLQSKKVENLTQLIAHLSDKEALANIYGIGEKVAEGILFFFAQEENLKLLSQLSDFWLNFSAREEQELQPATASFSITGTFPVSRQAIIDQLTTQGLLYHNTPLTSTTYMLIGEKAWSKAQKAQKYWLQLFENWEAIVQAFGVKFEEKSNPIGKTPMQQGLF